MVYGDEVKDGEAGVSMGGDNFLGRLRNGERLAGEESGEARFDDKNCETSVRRATGGAGPAGSTQPGSPASTRQGSLAGSAPGSPASRKSSSSFKSAANPRAAAAV
jgi:hypothetical protein